MSVIARVTLADGYSLSHKEQTQGVTMLKSDVHIGGYYTTTVSGKPAAVRIDSVNRFGGWIATNMNTGRQVTIKSGRRLQREVTETDVARYQSRKAVREVHNGNGHTNGNGNTHGVCEVCGEPTFKPTYKLCLKHYRESQAKQNQPKVGDKVTVKTDVTLLSSKNLSADNVITRMSERVGNTVKDLRGDAAIMDDRGYHQYATHLSNLAYALENALMDEIEKLM
jgi:hypothetical protein